MQRPWLAALALVCLPATAPAALKPTPARHIHVEHRLASAATPAALYRALGQVGSWWSSSHTFSGAAANLSLKLEAGGCFCEIWNDGSVAHGRVVETRRDRLARLDARLGPLLAIPVTAVLTFSFEPNDKGTSVVVSYRVSGDATESFGMKGLAPAVDRVVGEQTRRLVRFAETGKPE
jgi:uncharacterized protein YndB with AHSA1/START domain